MKKLKTVNKSKPFVIILRHNRLSLDNDIVKIKIMADYTPFAFFLKIVSIKNSKLVSEILVVVLFNHGL